ncbi:MAG: hypothetical protein IJ002_06605 [Clostridia bacterium]|nr:hypothetical protein [Clostridia bacterium]
MNATGMTRARYTTSVKDVIIAKAIQNGYNPYCKSTDANARRVTDEMRAKASRVVVPETGIVVAKKQKAVVREAAPAVKPQRARREIVHIENFELVKSKGTRLSLSMLVSVMITAMVLAMVVFSGSLINEEARRYSELSDTLAELKEEDKTLTLALEEKHNSIDIADVADGYGMVTANSAAVEYLSLSSGDSVEVYDADNGNTPVTVELLNTFGDKLSGFLEYLD